MEHVNLIVNNCITYNGVFYCIGHLVYHDVCVIHCNLWSWVMHVHKFFLIMMFFDLAMLFKFLQCLNVE